jgi:hypothetical protein
MIVKRDKTITSSPANAHIDLFQTTNAICSTLIIFAQHVLIYSSRYQGLFIKIQMMKRNASVIGVKKRSAVTQFTCSIFMVHISSRFWKSHKNLLLSQALPLILMTLTFIVDLAILNIF